MEVTSTLWSIRHIACLSASVACLLTGPKIGVDWDTVFTCLPMALIGCIVVDLPCAIDVLLALCTHMLLYGLSLRPRPSPPEPVPELLLPHGAPSLLLPQLGKNCDTDSTTGSMSASDSTSAVDVHYVVFDHRSRFAEDLLVVLLILATAAVSLRKQPPQLAIGLTVLLAVGITIFFQRRPRETLLTPGRVPLSRPLATLAAALCGGCYQNMFLLPSLLMVGLPTMQATMTALSIACFPLVTKSLTDVVQHNIFSTVSCLALLSSILIATSVGFVMKQMPAHVLTMLVGTVPLGFIVWQFTIPEFVSFMIAWWIRVSTKDVDFLTKPTDNTWTKVLRATVYIASFMTTSLIAVVVANCFHFQTPPVQLGMAFVCVASCWVVHCLLDSALGARVCEIFLFTSALMLSMCTPLVLLRGVACGALWKLLSVAYPGTSFDSKRWYPRLTIFFMVAAVLYDFYSFYHNAYERKNSATTAPDSSMHSTFMTITV
eukprot:GEMP01008232.1.p1 GENE.GEMP01008232.1~~GEMP01008232.1.p1  ORF type:complete len:488 (+),score=66.49 GEMP01008232.1:166-1629(+)